MHFVLSLIRLMILDVHLQRSLHLIKSGPSLRTRQAWGPLVYYQEAFVIFVITLTFLKTKLMSAQGRSPSYIQQGFHLYCRQGLLEGDMLHASTSGWFARRLTTWIILTSVGRSILLPMYVCQRKRRITSQWRRQFNEKVGCVDWFKSLIRKVD